MHVNLGFSPEHEMCTLLTLPVTGAATKTRLMINVAHSLTTLGEIGLFSDIPQRTATTTNGKTESGNDGKRLVSNCSNGNSML